MHGDKTSAREDFLINSARLLATSSPSTSSHLSSERTSLLYHSGRPLTQPQRRELCPACGSLQLPGWSGSLFRHPTKQGISLSAKARSIQTRRPHPQPRDRQVVFECRACHQKTFENLPPSQKSVHHKDQARSSNPNNPERVTLRNPQTALDSHPTPTRLENTSSRIRAKARKGGLQALLERSKEHSQSSAPSNLNLLDFMKP